MKSIDDVTPDQPDYTKPQFVPMEVAEFVGIGPNNIYAEVRSARMKASNTAPIGKRPRWRISRASIDEWFESRSNRT